MSTEIDNLRDAIRNLHGCESGHVESVPVMETWQGETVWDGDVEVFDLIGHPTVERAYAWAHETDEGKVRYVAVLHHGPIDSPANAVRAAVVAEVRDREIKKRSP